MLFSSRLPLSSLIELCRVLRHYMSSGLTLLDVFRQQAQRGAGPVRPLAARICRSLEKGEDLEKALKPEKAAFPPLFIALTSVGEETGNLPEICGELEKYFLLQKKLRNQFLGMIAWPVLQFNAAIFVIAGLLWAMAIVADINPGTKPIDPIGLGLVGGRGALIFLGLAYGSLAALFVLYLVLTRALRQQAGVDRFFLAIPVIGPCLKALALTRFCLALRLTLETGMSIANALRLSLRATGNAAFVARMDVVVDSVRRGEDLTLALTAARLFPPTDFLNIVAVAEESGRLSEVMRHQTQHYEEESVRRLTMLNLAASFLVWLFVAILIIIAIFRIFMVYIGMLDPANYGL